MKFVFSISITLFVITFVACKKDIPAPLANADFYVENNNCNAPCTLYFYNQSAHAIKWRWDFGNSKQSSKENPSINYASGGLFDVELVVWNSDDISDTIVKSIKVN
ncbi:PKD domain-containing protein [Crocinitomix catalasitica]|uniref:PKD domain-containing protein n=1 Tax=Crocinitomix catalasitica TaxID=184607 RepID=UPI0009FEB5F0|nr:PKD domain-containing protein [Crocinitomix catalasitica]